MIESIEGKITYIQDDYVIVLLNGIEYKILITKRDFEWINGDPEHFNKFYKFSIYEHITETSKTWYGFLVRDERDLIFKEIIKVKGVGPKSAMSILSELSEPTHEWTIEKLKTVKGISEKKAEEIVKKFNKAALV